MCKIHYARFKRHGDPLEGRIEEGDPLRFLLANINFEGDGCILWPYAMLSSGYGSIEYEGKTARVHRVMCGMVHGPAPSSRLDAAHSCGTRLCINPRHLRWATRSENMADAIKHGTTTRGECHGGHKLTKRDVLEIRSRLSSGDSHELIASAYGVGRTTITDIAKGKNWSWLQEQDGTGRGAPLVAFDWQSGGDVRHNVSEHHTSALQANQTPAVAFAQNQLGEVRVSDVVNTLNTNSNASGRNTGLVSARTMVRRITPMEAERLQGFPDGFTAITYRGKPAKDGPRYRALGNSMAIPVVRWILGRLVKVDSVLRGRKK